MRLFHNTNIDFLKIKWICISLSILSIVVGTISLVAKGGPNLGIDFTGGAQIVYAFSKTPDEDQIRKIVEGANVKVDLRPAVRQGRAQPGAPARPDGEEGRP